MTQVTSTAYSLGKHSVRHVLQAMARIAKHYRSRFTTVVGFQPTGWSHAQTRGKASHGKRRQKGTLITYQV